MNPILICLIVFLVAAFLIAFYMDWLGLWVSKAEMQEQIDGAIKRKAKATLKADTASISLEQHAVEHPSPIINEFDARAKTLNPHVSGE